MAVETVEQLAQELAREEKQNQSAEEIWKELYNIRESIANELYPI